MYRTESNKLIAEFMGLTPYYNINTYEYGMDYRSGYELQEVMYCNMRPVLKTTEQTVFGQHVGTVERYLDFDEQPDDFKYHYCVNYDTSWDWLMPVVEKIESICMDNFYCTDKMGDIFRGLYLVKIQDVIPAVTQFIEWYNTNLKP